MNPLDVQMGGTHYKGLPYQPVVLITKLNFNFIQGNIVKYVSRYKNKNGKEDLMKALHYAQLGEELKPCSFAMVGEFLIKEIHDYVEMNNFDDTMSRLFMLVVYQDWLGLVSAIKGIIKQYD